MATTHSAAVKNAKANAAVDLVDGGPAAGYIEIRTGTKPASPDSAATGTLLATLVMSDPAFGDAAGGVATANAIANGTIAATGTAGWGRVYDSTGVAIFDGDCATSGAQFNFADLNFLQNNEASLSSMTYTETSA